MNAPSRGGLWYAVSAYLLWGLLPLYFLTLSPVGAWELVALRILLSLVFCAVLLSVTRTWRSFLGLLRNRRILALFGCAGVLIWVNWTTYVVAVLSNHVVEASLGYFINPLVTIFLGVLVLRERLRPLQWAAVAISAIAVLTLTIGYGQFPWLALTLAFSFGIYGFVKKKAGPTVDAVSGLTLETLWLAPVAVVQLVIVAATEGLVFGSAHPTTSVLLSLAGVITAVPLLLFAAAARRVPLVYLGLFQFAAPVMQFVVGVTLLHEEMTTARWIGFIIVWFACMLLIVDALRSARATRPEPSVATAGDESDPLGTLETRN
ncbi:MAG TPA: EamA family transporter RarD [Microbacteriaceae bacterium]|nr:EamA family transporter RarD [Microbacteriaceae bacterium]